MAAPGVLGTPRGAHLLVTWKCKCPPVLHPHLCRDSRPLASSPLRGLTALPRKSFALLWMEPCPALCPKHPPLSLQTSKGTVTAIHQ